MSSGFQGSLDRIKKRAFAQYNKEDVNTANTVGEGAGSIFPKTTHNVKNPKTNEEIKKRKSDSSAEEGILL